ncbi:acyltransferase [Streptomyces sp. NBC_01549]|uniref:acyltransferase family protein n=1 Tax=Streptomyces sp. NBC_01549 TaxID=2975874 RepID=UPI0022537D9B|nr:acyltransferase [Streptomyces sp. NBC_01549]MCX4591820.1 acyltransferase [Streptomyces sp. NBC_01549]
MTQADTTAVGSPSAAATAARHFGRPRPDITRLPSLTGLRFPAALLVFLFHTGQPSPSLRLLQDDKAAMDYFKVTASAGALGVTFFFVLSGFVLTWSAREKDLARDFWRRRFVKIYPNYAITWALAMVLFASVYTPTRIALANLFMVHVWVPKAEFLSSVNTPSWSLACELVFYAAFPLLHKLFLRIRPEHVKVWITGAIAAVMATPFLTYALMPDTPTLPGGAVLGAKGTVEQYWITYILPPSRMLDFALGMLVALAVKNGRWRNVGIIWSSVLLAGGYVLCSYVPFLYAQRSVTIIPVIFLIAAAATADANERFTLFRNRTMVFLGEISFAFYLLHYIVLGCGRKVLDGNFSPAQVAGLVTAQLAITVFLSWVLYALVERPITRRFSKPRRPRAATG